MFDFNPVPKPNFKKGKKNKKDRSEFSEKTRQQIKEQFDGCCGHCGREGQHVHHVKTKGSGGRGVATNGLLLCAVCHTKIHADPSMAKYYIEEYTKMYGDHFYMDDEDLKGYKF